MKSFKEIRKVLNKVKVSVSRPIGYKIADIGPGKKEFNVKRVGPGSENIK